MEKDFWPRVAVALGRASLALFHLAKGPFAPEAAALTLGATAARIAIGAARSRRGYGGRSWVLALLLITAGGAAEVLPLDAAAQVVVGIVNATVLPGIVTFVSAMFAKLIVDRALPRLR